MPAVVFWYGGRAYCHSCERGWGTDSGESLPFYWYFLLVQDSTISLRVQHDLVHDPNGEHYLHSSSPNYHKTSIVVGQGLRTLYSIYWFWAGAGSCCSSLRWQLHQMLEEDVAMTHPSGWHQQPRFLPFKLETTRSCSIESGFNDVVLVLSVALFHKRRQTT
jgi:hypothetical protein